MSPTTYALIPGAASGPGYWEPVAGLLGEHGHEVLLVDLPCDDETAGIPAYIDAAAAAVGGREDVVVIGHSFGGFTATGLADRINADLLILVQAMVPSPGETPGEWWENSGCNEATKDRDIDPSDAATYYHDVSPEMVEIGDGAERGQSDAPTNDAWPLTAWPDVPTRYIVCTEDRFIPPDVIRRVVEDRLGSLRTRSGRATCRCSQSRRSSRADSRHTVWKPWAKATSGRGRRR